TTKQPSVALNAAPEGGVPCQVSEWLSVEVDVAVPVEAVVGAEAVHGAVLGLGVRDGHFAPVLGGPVVDLLLHVDLGPNRGRVCRDRRCADDGSGACDDQ